MTLPAGIDSEADNDTKIQQMLDRYGTGRVLYRNTRKGVSGFPTRHRVFHPLLAPSLYASNIDLLHPEVEHSSDDWIDHDPRVKWLEDHLKSLRPEKALVICAHRDTAIALEHHLHLKAGVRCALSTKISA